MPPPFFLPSLAGTLPNIARNAIVNCGELVTYDLIKDALLRAQLLTGEAGGMGRHRAPFPVPKTLTAPFLPPSRPQTTSPVTSWPLSGPGSAPRWWRRQWTW